MSTMCTQQTKGGESLGDGEMLVCEKFKKNRSRQLELEEGGREAMPGAFLSAMYKWFTVGTSALGPAGRT